MSINQVIVNASPLICLFRSGLQNVLGQLWKQVNVPGAVWEEILAGPENDKAARMLASTTWAAKVEAPPIPIQIAAWDLGPGESEVLSFALANPGCFAVIDDAEARRCARALGIPFLGTGGVLIIAKKKGHIESVSEALEALRSSGLYISNTVIRILRQKAGE